MYPVNICIYNGTFYRDIKAAQYAVFFDLLGVPFNYEPALFSFGKIDYCPDFFLPSLNCWLEVKSKCPDIEARFKAIKLSKITGEKVYISIGFFTSSNYPILYKFRGDTRDYTRCSWIWNPDTQIELMTEDGLEKMNYERRRKVFWEMAEAADKALATTFEIKYMQLGFEGKPIIKEDRTGFDPVWG